ncbi:Cysteine desulfurase IscS [bioreactor metagenome]|uniref:Cysteine desulfurase IscS n=1 Tax=bioreactor metagenome TaxID=1076179 RepID=A0A645DZF8_9ZZZZ
MWGNNEIGSINDIEALSSLCQKNNTLFHTDATQVLGKIPIDLKKCLVNFLSCSAHKLHGPKGIGACFIRKTKLGLKTKLTPLLHGGSQENGYRAGTLAVHNIVGFGKACVIARHDINKNVKHLHDLEKKLIYQLKEKLPLIEFNQPAEQKIPGIISITIPGINNELLVNHLAKSGFAVSTGSACSASEPSHVLTAIGATLLKSRSTIRISLDKYSTEQQLTKFSIQLENICNSLMF